MLNSILPYYIIPLLIYLASIILSFIFLYKKNTVYYIAILLGLFVIYLIYLTVITWLKPWMN